MIDTTAEPYTYPLLAHTNTKTPRKVTLEDCGKAWRAYHEQLLQVLPGETTEQYTKRNFAIFAKYDTKCDRNLQFLAEFAVKIQGGLGRETGGGRPDSPTVPHPLPTPQPSNRGYFQSRDYHAREKAGRGTGGGRLDSPTVPKAFRERWCSFRLGHGEAGAIHRGGIEACMEVA